MTSAGPYIAVVDDEASVRTALGRLLRLADYEVAAFASRRGVSRVARDAPSRLRDSRRAHGRALRLRRARRSYAPRTCDVPVVFITASDDPALDRTVAEAGGVTLLRKPFSNDALLEAVGAALRERKRIWIAYMNRPSLF